MNFMNLKQRLDESAGIGQVSDLGLTPHVYFGGLSEAFIECNTLMAEAASSMAIDERYSNEIMLEATLGGLQPDRIEILTENVFKNVLDKIVEFFKNAWTWIKGLISRIKEWIDKKVASVKKWWANIRNKKKDKDNKKDDSSSGGSSSEAKRLSAPSSSGGSSSEAKRLSAPSSSGGSSGIGYDYDSSDYDKSSSTRTRSGSKWKSYEGRSWDNIDKVRDIIDDANNLYKDAINVIPGKANDIKDSIKTMKSLSDSDKDRYYNKEGKDFVLQVEKDIKSVLKADEVDAYIERMIETCGGKEGTVEITPEWNKRAAKFFNGYEDNLKGYTDVFVKISQDYEKTISILNNIKKEVDSTKATSHAQKYENVAEIKVIMKDKIQDLVNGTKLAQNTISSMATGYKNIIDTCGADFQKHYDINM